MVSGQAGRRAVQHTRHQLRQASMAALTVRGCYFAPAWDACCRAERRCHPLRAWPPLQGHLAVPGHCLHLQDRHHLLGGGLFLPAGLHGLRRVRPPTQRPCVRGPGSAPARSTTRQRSAGSCSRPPTPRKPGPFFRAALAHTLPPTSHLPTQPSPPPQLHRHQDRHPRLVDCRLLVQPMVRTAGRPGRP